MDFERNLCYGRSGAYEITVSLKFSGNVVGYLSGNFISSRPDPNFYWNTEPVDAELWKVTKIFCDSRGVASRINHPILQSSKSKHEGGLLHISKIEVHPDHKGKDLGLYMIHHAFVFLRGEWSLAIIVPGILSSTSWHHEGAVRSLSPWWKGTPEEEREREKKVEDALVKLSQYYARMGFLQASKKHPGVWFLTSDHYDKSTPDAWIPKHESSKIVMFRATKWKELTGLDLQLSDYLKRPIIDELRGPSGLRNLIRCGASIEGSNAMTLASFHDNVTLFQVLIELGGNVNHRNERGQSPLHVAAARQSTRMVKFLVEAGAEKDAVDEAGRTPMDCFQDSIREKEDESFMVKMSPNENRVMRTHECFKVLMPQDKLDELVDGWMSQGMRDILGYYSDELTQIVGWKFGMEYFPSEVRQALEMDCLGGCQVMFFAIGKVLASGDTPTVQHISTMLDELDHDDQEKAEFFSSLAEELSTRLMLSLTRLNEMVQI